jgi:hypothetical protein
MSQPDDEMLPYGDERGRIYKASSGSRKNYMLLFVPHPTTPVKAQNDRLKQFSDIRDMQVRKDGQDIRIDFSDVTVIITGRNLHPVAFAIGAHACSRLEAFDADRRDLPTDPMQSFIEKIVYYTRDDEEANKRANPRHEPETERAEH